MRKSHFRSFPVIRDFPVTYVTMHMCHFSFYSHTGSMGGVSHRQRIGAFCTSVLDSSRRGPGVESRLMRGVKQGVDIYSLFKIHSPHH